MRYRRAVRRLFEVATNTRVYKTLPRGVDVFADIAADLGKLHVATVFDVGANIGQSALEYAEFFKGSQIYCFEPVEATFHRLQAAIRGRPHIRAVNLALGARAGSGTMVLEGAPEMFYLQSEAKSPAGHSPEGPSPDAQCPGRLTASVDTAPVGRQTVALQTLDLFCREQNVARIEFLKVDTEGHDLDVLRGAQRLLSDQKIDLIQVEAGMNPSNRRHVPFAAFTHFLEPYGYFLFGIYEQKHEWITGAPNLRRTNPVFVSERVMRMHSPDAERPRAGGQAVA